MALSSAVHYLVLRLNHARDLERVAYFRRSALRAAGVRPDSPGAVSGLGLGRAGKVDTVAVDTDAVLHQAGLGDAAPTPESAIKAPEPSAADAVAAPPQNRKERRQAGKAGARAAAPTPAASRPGSGTATPTTARDAKRRKVKVPLLAGSDRAGSLDLVVVDREVFVVRQSGGVSAETQSLIYALPHAAAGA